MKQKDTFKLARRALMLLAVLFSLTGARADKVTIGDAESTTTNYTLPVNTYYNYSLTQQIFTADEIGMAGTITSISFEYTHTAAFSMEGVRMYMMTVDKESFENTTDMVQISASDLVWEGTFAASEASWITIDLDTPFNYDGTGNLLVCFYDPTDGYPGSAFKFRTTSTYTEFPNQYLAILYCSDSAVPSVEDVTSFSGSGKSRYQYRSNIKLDIAPSGVTVCAKPSIAVSNITDSSATLTVSGGSETYNVEYKKTADETWTSVATNTTETTFALTGLDPLTAYEVHVQSVCSESATSEWRKVSFTTTAVAEAVGDSWSDDFEGVALGWELINGTCANAWVWGEATNNGGTHALYISNDGGTTNAYTNNNNASMVYATKLLNFTEGKYEFTYDWIANGEGNYDYLRVALVPATETLSAGTSAPSNFNSTTLPTGWIPLDGGSKLNLATAWQNKAVAVNVAAGNYYLVVAWRNDNSSGTNPPAAIDNVSISRVTCSAEVEDLAVSNVTANSATLTCSGDATEWQVAYSTDATFQGATEEIVSANTYGMTGLQSGTYYYVRVRAYCGGTDFGTWSDILIFHTEVEANTTYPWSENFDSYTGVTSGSTNNLPLGWNYINTSTNNSYNGYPVVYNNSSSSHSGNNHLRFYSFSYSSSSDPQDQYAILPPMENLDGKQLTLYARGANSQSSFTVGMMSDPTDASTFVPIGTTTPTTSYDEYDYYPNSSNGSYIAIKVEAANSSATSRTVYIDDITIADTPSCLKPYGLVASNVNAHNVILDWSLNDDTQTAWDVEVATDIDFSENVRLIENVNVHENYLLGGLDDEVTYYVRVRANCGGGDVSDWSKVATFTTPIACPAPTGLTVSNISGRQASLSWTGYSDGYNVSWRPLLSAEGLFEGFKTSSVPSGWSIYSGLLDEVLNGTTELTAASGYWNFGTYNGNGVFDSHARMNIYSTGRNHWLVTPSVEVADANYVLAFDLALTKYSGTLQPVEAGNQADDKFVVLISTDNMETWTILRQWDNAGSESVYDNIPCSATGQNVTIDLSSYAGQNVAIAFYGESTVAGGDNNLHIDNVIIGVPIPTGEWQTFATTETTCTLTGLNPERDYEVKIGSDCDGEQSHETGIVTFTTDVACPAPTGLTASNPKSTSIDLHWTSYADAWQICVNNDETNLIDINIDDVTFAVGYIYSYTLTGLNPATDYTVKVRGNYGNVDGLSEWSEPLSFTTLETCAQPTDVAASNISYDAADINWIGDSESFTVSYRTAEQIDGWSEDFGAGLPDGWTRSYTLLTDDVLNGTTALNTSTSGGWYVGNYNGVFNNHAVINIYGINCKSWLVTPSKILVANAQLTFDLALTAYNGTLGTPATTGTDDKFVVLISTDGGVTWTILRQWDNVEGSEFVYNNITCSETGEQVNIDLSSYAGESVKVAFYGESTEQNADNNLHIDNVSIGVPVAAGEWQTVTATGGATTVHLSDLTPGTRYDVIVSPGCDEDNESEVMNFTTIELLEFADNADNVFIINDYNSKRVNLKLQGRTLWQDDAWNTLCLPFDVTVANSPLTGADVRTLTSASFSGGSLTLNFTGEGDITELTAGTPYIIKWASGSNILNPVFTGVTIDKTMRDVPCDLGDGKSITFKGTYGYTAFTEANKSILFMGAENTLYYPGNGAEIGACRAYFELDGISAEEASTLVKQIVLTFDGSDATLIQNLNVDDNLNNGDWYDLSGRKLSPVNSHLSPVRKGIYIVNGKKILK